MNLLSRLLSLLALLVLSACGGGGGSAGTPVVGGGGDGGPTNAPRLTVALSSPTVTAASPATVTATLVNAAGVPLPGVVVAFTTENGLGAFSAPTALTNEQGVATVTLSPVNAAATGADTVRASATVGTAAVSGTIGFQLTATNVTIASFTSDLTTIGAYGQTALQVTLAGATPGTPVNVALSSSCVSKGLATLTPPVVSTSTGVASFTYRDQGCGSFDAVDGIQASVTGSGATASLQLNLTAPTASSISFVSASPEVIFLKGSGFVENSNIVFQVRDANGAGIPNRNVVLEPTTLAGGLLVDGGSDPVVKRTDSEGRVLVRVNAGTVPTPVRIRATLEGSTISTVSSSLAIAVGLPSQENFSLSQGTINIEGYNRDGTRNTYTIIASDRLGNPVPTGTAINFVTESGQVEAIRATEMVEGLAQATANFQSSQPRPLDGRMTVVAYALGEESFLDANGNNVFDTGEDWQDLGDVYIDRLFNNTYNALEDQFISLTVSGNAACRIATSDLLKLDVTAPSRTLTNTGQVLGTCTEGWGRAYVRRATQTVLSTSSARPSYGNRLPANARVNDVAQCPVPNQLIIGYTGDDSPVRVPVYEFGTVMLAGMPASGVVNLVASDANPVAYNPMAAGTTISVATTRGLTATVAGGSPVPSTSVPSGVALTYAFDEITTSGTITVTFTSPASRLSTSYSQFITTQSTGVACP